MCILFEIMSVMEKYSSIDFSFLCGKFQTFYKEFKIVVFFTLVINNFFLRKTPNMFKGSQGWSMSLYDQ